MADGIVFRTTDNDRWGAAGGVGTGGNLTPIQFDENNWELLTRLQQLENNPPQAVSIVNVTVIGSQFELNMSDGSTLGPYTLPIATFTLNGTWVNNMTYDKLVDFILQPHIGLFVANVTHTSPPAPAVFDPDAIDEDSGSPTFGEKLWQLVFGEDQYIYDVGFMMPGRPGQGISGGDTMFSHVFDRPVTNVINFTGAVAVLDTAPAAALSFPLKKNATDIGTVDFALGAVTGTFTIAAAQTFAIGDRFRVMPPTVLDTDAKGLAISIPFVRNDIA